MEETPHHVSAVSEQFPNSRDHYAQAGAMSDALHGSTMNISALVDEIVAKRRPRGEGYKRSSYPGLRNRTGSVKYRGCVYVGPPTNRVRQLSADEIEELRAHVGRCMEARS